MLVTAVTCITSQVNGLFEGWWFNSSWENKDIQWSLEKADSSLNPNLYSCSSALEQGTSAALPSSCRPCHLCLRSLTLLTVTDKMSMWMYANVIFVVHYSLKDRSWTISFPFMRLPCWPAEWRYSNYSFPRLPAALYWVCIQRCCTAAKCEREAGISRDSRGGAEQL